jgi:hypothetical protein
MIQEITNELDLLNDEEENLQELIEKEPSIK